jgi:uncharacterized protein YxjI
VFDSSHYEVRQKVRLSNQYNVYEGGREDPILRSAQKRFRLKEDFRFEDPETGEERFRVKASSVLDIASAYDVVDSQTGERLGAVKRSATSFARHEYALLDPDGNQIATVREDSLPKAILRRYVTTLVPFSYDIVDPSGQQLGSVTGAFSLRDRYDVEVDPEAVDPRLAVIATVVIDAIEEN